MPIGDRTLVFRRDALRQAGYGEVPDETAGGGRSDGPAPAGALAHSGVDDTLVARRRDRFGRLLEHLIGLVAALVRRARAIGIYSLPVKICLTPPSDKPVFRVSNALVKCERDPVRGRS